MKNSSFSQNMSKAIAFLFAATFAVSFTACTDDILNDNDQPVATPDAAGQLLEAYGLTYQDFTAPNDVIILNADTTQISVSKNLADKLGITSFVNHPLGIWHQINQLPYARKATAEELVGDRYILTVERATVAELIGDKEVMLNTGLYVNDDNQRANTRVGGIDMPDYAAKYIDDNHIIHPAVIHLTDPLGYDGYHDTEGRAATRSASNNGCYDYITPEQAGTRASAHKRILSFNQEVKVHKKFACGKESSDSLDFDLKVPMDFELNYFVTLNGGVKWKVCVPVPYVKKFEAGLDGKFAFSPEMTLGFTKEFEFDEKKCTKTLVTFPSYSFTFWVGCVPVVIDCQPNLYAKFEGKITGQACMGFKYEYENNFKGGIRYESGDGWSAIKEFEEVKNSFTLIRPQVKVHAETGIGIYLGMDVIIEGVAGPTVSVGPKLGIEAELTMSPFEKNWNEKLNYSASIGLSVNAEAGAKLKVLGYELAEYKATFSLAGPWILKKYPSDGSEHKVGDLTFTTADYNNFNALMNGILHCKHSATYSKYATPIKKMLCEMYDIDDAAADKILKKYWMTKMKKQYGCIPTESNRYEALFGLLETYAVELGFEYNDFLEQQAGDNGDTEYLAQKNWENIMELLKTNDDVMRFLTDHKGQDKTVHEWFVKDFNREPSVAPEDLEWLADHMVNFNNYIGDYTNSHPEWADKGEEGWDAVTAKLKSLYSDVYADSPKNFTSGISHIKTWYFNKYLGQIKISTKSIYFDEVNEEFVEYMNKEKGYSLEVRS